MSTTQIPGNWRKSGKVERRVSSIVMILFCALLFGGVAQANDANNWGYLKIDVRLEGKEMGNSVGITKDDSCYPDTNDLIDTHDIEEVLFWSDRSGGYSLVAGKKLGDDFRQNSSRTPVHVKGYFNGTIASENEPNITVELSWLWAEEDVGRFGDMPLISTKEDANGNNIENDGYRGHIRAEMAYSGPDFASINFGKLPAGTYTPDTPFLHLRLDFDKPLADLNNDNEVNLKDYAFLAKRWREEGRCIADISGPNDVPDMVVDYYDLAIIARDWLG